MIVFVLGVETSIPHQFIEELKKVVGQEATCVNVQYVFTPLPSKNTIHQLKATREDVAFYVEEQYTDSDALAAIALPYWYESSPTFLALFSATVAHVTKQMPKVIMIDAAYPQGSAEIHYHFPMIR